ncbi:diguanylate cyclase [Desulfosporosinus sp. PR]|uniref:sensor domain-containing diguanylate cyclase n=1 Tax=Candidatus Desulfosporosinus nitrosoreducens TaxID=3401928 RepID=UPI0027EDF930|nr:diguanylate cyclase [Desulfosporosinus sp. PR]MDQ7093646.1 diguanylate cyclase [Desulfosporosinus sp. PR]
MEELKPQRIIVLYFAVILTGLLVNIVSFYAVSRINQPALPIYPASFSDGQHNLSYRLLGPSEPETASFRASIAAADLKKTGSGDYALLIYQLNCQAYRLYFNQTLLGSAGDMETARSNIWNMLNCFYIDHSLVRQDNELRIETKSIYDSGLSSLPVFIVPLHALPDYLGAARFFSEGINLVSIGLTLFGALMIFMLYLLASPKNTAFLYFSGALFFMTIYTLDYIPFSHVPVAYLTYKKMMILALYLAIALGSLGIYRFFHTRTDKIIALATLVGIIALEIAAGDMATFEHICNYYNLMIVLNILSWLFTAARHCKERAEARLFFSGAVFAVLLTAANGYISLNRHSFKLSTPFSYALLFSTITIILFFSEHLNRQKQLQIVDMEKAKTYNASIRDGMTGLYNHAYMVSVMSQIAHPYAVVMADIDNLKEINDSFGHRCGDAVICHVADCLKRHVRSSDLVFRYGGDEFFLILLACDAERAKEVMAKIEHCLKTNGLRLNGEAFPITLSGGIYAVEREEETESIFNKVDTALYRAKSKGKNDIGIYEL